MYRSSVPPRSVVRQALLDIAPLLVPVVPFALVLGLTIAESPMSNFVGWLGAPIIFGGAAQLAVITLLGANAALLAVVAAGVVINARHFMYSAALAPTFGLQPRWFRWLGPYFLVDQVFALMIVRIHDDPLRFRQYYLVAGAGFWAVWQVTVALGLVVGPAVPEAWSLEFAVPLMFLGLLISAIKDRPGVIAAAVGAAVTYATLGLANRVGLILGGLAGVAAGTVAARVSRGSS